MYDKFITEKVLPRLYFFVLALPMNDVIELLT